MDVKNVLNENEFKVFELIKDGKTTKQMSEILDIKEYEVKTFQQNIYNKLNVFGKSDIIKNNFNTMDVFRKKEKKTLKQKKEKIS